MHEREVAEQHGGARMPRRDRLAVGGGQCAVDAVAATACVHLNIGGARSGESVQIADGHAARYMQKRTGAE